MSTSSSRSSSSDPRARWTAPGAGARYEEKRWSHGGRRARDPAVLRRILARLGAPSPSARILDVPCGSGRLRSVVEGGARYVGLDVSAEMLRAAAEAHVREGTGPASLLRGDADRLPFPDGAFDGVVCCRLLHHLPDGAAVRRTLAELLRVSSSWVAASVWDSGSVEALRRRLPFVRRPRHRIARPRAFFEAAARDAGARIVAWHAAPGLSRWSQQVWFVARLDDAADGGA